ncbi:hypothetical protein AaE_015536 [Aphanomyces astaci]|uniref:Integrase catalytic domain-containing protein n=1 Tax=Aphanomyces astaci TaxID=112090 RepID=A0A6A4Z1V0_APHAT|nr:hypothetical protein AaE_015536 [Aphanomyces astaci]
MVQEISIAQANGDMKTYRHETDGDKSGGPMELEDEIDEVTADLANYATMLRDDDDECNNVLSSKAEVIVDSGATCHMTGDETILHDAIACKRGVRLADGHPISVTTMGNVRMKSRDTGRTVVFRNVLLVPSLTKTLISISRITDSADAASILFKKDYCNIRSRTHLSIVGKWNAARLYAVHGDVIKPRPAADQANSAEVAEPMLWHARCGHVPWNSMSAMIKAMKGGPTNLRLPDSLSCEGCIRGKKTHTSPPKEGDRPRHKLGTCVHTDLWGPAKVESPNGAKYFVSFTEDATNYVWVKFLRKKSDTFAAMKEYLPWLERQSGAKLKTMRSDNGGEFIGDEVEAYLTERGIHHETSTAGRQWQNGTAERMNRTLVEMARTMMLHSNVSNRWWAEAVNTAAFLRNRVPNTKTDGKTPHERLRGTTPKIGNLKVFGCVCHRHVDPKDKTSSRTNKCLFIGYNETKKAYKVYDLEDEKVMYSVDITFHENEFLRPKAVLADADGVQVTKTEGQPADDQPLADDGDDDMGQEQPPRTPAQNTPKSDPLATPRGQRQPPPTPYARYPPRVLFRDDPATEAAEDEINPLPQAANTIRTGRENPKARAAAQTQIRETANETMQNVRRSARISEVTQRRHKAVAAPETKPPFHPTRATARPHDADSPYMEAPAKTMRTTADRGITTREYEDNAALAYDVCMNVADVDDDVPATFWEAMQTPDAANWLDACKKEVSNLQRMQCYRVVTKPHGCRALKSKWVFKRKDMPDGSMAYKARVVIKGCAQRRGIDYDETYAPVVRGDSLRLTLAIVTERGMKCRQGDATIAYIHADSDRMLHMDMPEGFGDDSGRVWAIDKALYGMKQSALMWYLHFKGILEDDGFAATRSDGCVFTRRTNGALQIITIYVDDILVCAETDEEVDAIFNHMQAHIRLNDMGSVSKLLGMEIYRNEDEMTMDVLQVTYIERMAAKYGLASANAVDTPIPPGTNLSEDIGAVLNDDKPYRQIVGSLLYCAMATRPDIVHAVTQLSRHLTQPHQLHMHMARRVVAYLLHTKTVGLSFTGGRRGSDKLVGFSDSSWADDRTTGRSTCGYLWMMAGGAISWRSKLQAIVTLSTAEAEYVGACLGAQHGMHLRNLLGEFGQKEDKPVVLYLDNQSAIAIGSNQASIQRTKHLALRFYFLRDLVKSGKFTLAHLPTNVMPADVFTKHVSKDKLKTAMAFMGMGGCCGFCP